MLKEITSYDGIYLACGATDLRKSVDGLAIIVKQEFNMDPFGNYLFLFCNRNRNRLKCLNWDKNGFVLYYKRPMKIISRVYWKCGRQKDGKYDIV